MALFLFCVQKVKPLGPFINYDLWGVRDLATGKS